MIQYRRIIAIQDGTCDFNKRIGWYTAHYDKVCTFDKLSTEWRKLTLGYVAYIIYLERKSEIRMAVRYKNHDCKSKFERTTWDKNRFCAYLGECYTNPNMDILVSELTDHCHCHVSNSTRFPVLQLKARIRSRSADDDNVSSIILCSLIRYFPFVSTGSLSQHEMLLRTERK
jgi:hypothetical protein